ncbi:MAG: DNA primase [Prevotellaceae bacterium]|nr:DNA primase [Prevotellaceae bacterium]
MIDQLTIDRILDAAQIVDVVSDFVTLRKRGVNFVGLCPFHDDKTPSFYVSPSKGLCKCFACGKGGNAVHFIMEHEQVSFPDALRYLAKKYGIEIKEREQTAEEKAAQGERDSLFVVNTFARDYFRETLKHTPDGQSIGMAYFRDRGFRDDIIEKFQLGYDPDKADALAREAEKRGYKREYLVKTGLCYETNDGRLVDRFRGRVIFPVHTLSGKIVAFGGRKLDSATKGIPGKYVNSPESEIYHKSNELYGIFFAKQAIVKQDRCYLVEGYTDVISMHQSGVENVVASSGTALTTHQIKLIHRFTNNITVLYDGDVAGIKASLRGIDMLLEEGMNIKVCLLPDGEDPDSFARKHHSDGFRAFIAEHETDFIRFKTNLLMEEAGKDPLRRAELIGSLVQSISVIPEAIMRDIYIKECAQLLRVEDKLLVGEVAKRREEQANKPIARPVTAAHKNDEPQPDTAPGAATDAAPAADGGAFAEYVPTAGKEADEFYRSERSILRMMVRYGERVMCNVLDADGNEQPLTVIEYIDADMRRDDLAFHHPLHRLMLAEAVEHLHDGEFKAERYFLAHPDAEVSRLSSDLVSDRYQLSKYHSKTQTLVKDEERLHELVPMLMTDFKYTVVRQEMKHLIRNLQSTDPADPADAERCNELLQRIEELGRVQNIMAHELGDRVVLRL